jgi:hypothetical protein
MLIKLKNCPYMTAVSKQQQKNGAKLNSMHHGSKCECICMSFLTNHALYDYVSLLYLFNG